MKKGFSLVEVMVAAVVLISGIAAVLVGHTSSIRTAGHLKRLTVASQVAEGVVEDLLATASTSDVLAAGAHVTSNGAPLGFDAEGESAPIANAKYTATWNVVPNRAGNSAYRGISQVTVTVSWTGDTGPRSTSLTFHRD